MLIPLLWNKKGIFVFTIFLLFFWFFGSLLSTFFLYKISLEEKIYENRAYSLFFSSHWIFFQQTIWTFFLPFYWGNILIMIRGSKNVNTKKVFVKKNKMLSWRWLPCLNCENILKDYFLFVLTCRLDIFQKNQFSNEIFKHID